MLLDKIIKRIIVCRMRYGQIDGACRYPMPVTLECILKASGASWKETS